MATTTSRADDWRDKSRDVFPSRKDRKPGGPGVYGGGTTQFLTVLKKFTKKGK